MNYLILSGLLLVWQLTDTSSRLKSEYPPLQYGQRHALVVGITKYDHADTNGFDDLTGPHQDAVDLALVLSNRFGFQVTLLVDRQASAFESNKVLDFQIVDKITLNVLQKCISVIGTQIKDQSALLFYYAGHGFRSMESGFLVPHDGRTSGDKLLNLKELAKQLRECGAHHTLMILDSCFSGVMLNQNRGVTLQPTTTSMPAFENETLGKLIRRPVFQIITAGASAETVADVPKADLSRNFAESQRDQFQGHSPFTAVLLQALRGQLGNPEGQILASQLGFHIAEALVHEDAGQVPGYERLGGEGDFIFLPRPGLPIIDPRLVASLYLAGDQYAELRVSAVETLLQQVGNAERGKRIAGDVISHLTKAVRDSNEKTRSAAVHALAELSKEYSKLPEFASAVEPLAMIMSLADVPDAVQLDAAFAFANLEQHSQSQKYLKQFREYVIKATENWKAHNSQRALPPTIASRKLEVERRLKLALKDGDSFEAWKHVNTEVQWLYETGSQLLTTLRERASTIVAVGQRHAETNHTLALSLAFASADYHATEETKLLIKRSIRRLPIEEIIPVEQRRRADDVEVYPSNMVPLKGLAFAHGDQLIITHHDDGMLGVWSTASKANTAHLQNVSGFCQWAPQTIPL